MTRFSSWDSPVLGSLPLTPADAAGPPWPGDVSLLMSTSCYKWALSTTGGETEGREAVPNVIAT
ncbi:hypothetical protein GCM10025781_09870 [Kocuria gwangalliensis]|uniref:Uncharacterized protein n=1 Tax=Kocuria gwangalliensis TaxID=501592 RepID=A0ABP8WVL9_9MICC